jgi:hypothetical protein
MFADLLGQLADGGFDAASSPVVFGSAYGEMATTMELLELQASSGQSSPLRFQLSVHNTAAGLLSIALGNRGFSTSIAAGTNTFAMAMLEGIVYLNHAGANEVAVLVADEASVSPLSSQRHGPVAAGFHLRRVERTRPEPCWLVRAPCRGRVSGDELARVRADRDNENPVSDALDLVAAFRGQEPRKLLLGKRRQNHEPASHPSGWVLELVRHPGA